MWGGEIMNEIHVGSREIDHNQQMYLFLMRTGMPYLFVRLINASVLDMVGDILRVAKRRHNCM